MLRRRRRRRLHCGGDTAIIGQRAGARGQQQRADSTDYESWRWATTTTCRHVNVRCSCFPLSVPLSLSFFLIVHMCVMLLLFLFLLLGAISCCATAGQGTSPCLLHSERACKMIIVLPRGRGLLEGSTRSERQRERERSEGKGSIHKYRLQTPARSSPSLKTPLHC